MDAVDHGARSRRVRVTGHAAAGLAGGVLTVLVLGCAVFTALSRGIIAARWTLLVVLLVWLLCLTLLAALSRAFLSRRTTAVLVAGAALTMQGLALAGGSPLLSDDLYRYVWDARVAEHGTDPYARPPADPALVPLRTPDLWPSAADCARPRADLPRTAMTSPFIGADPASGCTLLNRPSVRTIYPPAAELAFRVGGAVVPDRLAVERKAQLPAIVTSLLLTGALLWLARRTRQHPASVLLYAASPLAMVEAGADAHIDVLAALLGVAAVWLLSRDRPGRAGLTAIGVVLSLA
ncbi:MAG: hypothetical protein JWL64_1392, partial [Frankiales bacterium]|nr:hypothetical protein [Frankiales bacterium]